MKSIKQFILTLFVMSVCSMAFAGTQTLTTISVSQEKYILELRLIVDEKSDIKEFKLVEILKGKTVLETAYSTKGTKDGIVLMEQSGRKVVKLISDNFSDYNGGNIEINYLYNGITGKRRTLDMELQRDGDKWSLYVKGKKSTRMHFVKNKKAFVGVVGIKQIEVK